MEVRHYLRYQREMNERARELRKNMTPQENKLWYMFLRRYPEKIYRQRVIGSFIVDFYCASARLVIEADGAQHYSEQGQAYDLERSTLLDKQRVKVLRFTNQQIDDDFEETCGKIDAEIKKRIREIEEEKKNKY